MHLSFSLVNQPILRGKIHLMVESSCTTGNIHGLFTFSYGSLNVWTQTNESINIHMYPPPHPPPGYISTYLHTLSLITKHYL